MESPCKKCKKYNIPKCIDSCKKLKDFQTKLLVFRSQTPTNQDYVLEDDDLSILYGY